MSWSFTCFDVSLPTKSQASWTARQYFRLGNGVKLISVGQADESAELQRVNLIRTLGARLPVVVQNYYVTEYGKHCVFHGARLLLIGPPIGRLGVKEVDDIHVAATVFAASNLRKVGRFPNSSADELWIANIKACGSARQCRVFTDVMFVESIGAGFIFGIEREDGRPLGVKAELAERQQLFIDFLRAQNEISDLAMGGLRAIFQDSEYAAEARATAAYMIHREHLTDLALGYRNREGEYVCEKFEHEQRFLGSARATLPFDELPR